MLESTENRSEISLGLSTPVGSGGFGLVVLSTNAHVYESMLAQIAFSAQCLQKEKGREDKRSESLLMFSRFSRAVSFGNPGTPILHTFRS